MVVMRPAFAWDCPECGCENFARGMVPDLPEEQLVAMRDEQGIEPWEDGDFVMMPERVKCDHCGAVHEATHFKDA